MFYVEAAATINHESTSIEKDHGSVWSTEKTKYGHGQFQQKIITVCNLRNHCRSKLHPGGPPVDLQSESVLMVFQ